MDSSQKLEKYLEHHDATIYTSYTDDNNCSFHVYREDTADGHEVFIAKYTGDSHVNIMDDVHYYSNDLFNIILEKIHEGETIYVDEDLWYDNYMEDEVADKYDEESDEWEVEND